MPISSPSPAQKSLLLFALILIFYLIVVEYILQYTDTVFPVQIFETNLVVAVQSFFAVDVYAEGSVLFYPYSRLSLYVGPICVGLREMALFSIVVLSLSMVSLKTRLRGLAIFLPLIFLENFLRLLVIFPIYQSAGFEGMVNLHDLLWQYGQIIFLVLLLFIWFHFFAKKELGKSARHKHKSNTKNKQRKQT